jgi:hypothetical protein
MTIEQSNVRKPVRLRYIVSVVILTMIVFLSCYCLPYIIDIIPNRVEWRNAKIL